MHLCLISNYLFLVHFTVILYKMQLLNSIYNSQLQHLKYGVKLMCSFSEIFPIFLLCFSLVVFFSINVTGSFPNTSLPVT